MQTAIDILNFSARRMCDRKGRGGRRYFVRGMYTNEVLSRCCSSHGINNFDFWFLGYYLCIVD
jgi:hypothetical protein